MSNLESKTVLVLGGSGMLGSAVIRRLSLEKSIILAPSSDELNLLHQNDLIRYCRGKKIDSVVHCAGKVGGIFANQSNQYNFLVENAFMALNAVSEAHACDIPEFYYFASSCMYPRESKQPMTEDMLLTGKFEDTNKGYAMAKSLGTMMIDLLHERGLKYHTLIPPNLYGLGDNYSESGHFIAAIVKKVADAKLSGEPVIDMRGTGSAVREIMHVDDCAVGLYSIMTKGHPRSTINIGTNYGTSVKEWAYRIAKFLNWNGSFTFQEYSEHDGMPYKVMKTDRYLNWTTTTGSVEMKHRFREMEQEYLLTLQQK